MALRLRKKSSSECHTAAVGESMPTAEEAARKLARKSKGKIAAERDDRIAAYRWKPGQSGNPAGRPPGTGSIVKWLKKRLEGPAFRRPDKFVSLAQELANVILKQASKGNYNFVQLLVDRAESRQMTEEEMMSHTEKIFSVCCKYVLEPEVRQNIARDLGINLKEQYE